MSTKFKHLLSLAVVASFILLETACSDGKTVDANQKPVQNVQAIQVFNDFTENELAAKEKYGNKVIAVRGIVAKIETDGDGSLVLINDGNPENVGIRCYFNEDQNSLVTALKKDDPVKIIGEGAASLSINYVMLNCRMGKLGEN